MSHPSSLRKYALLFWSISTSDGFLTRPKIMIVIWCDVQKIRLKVQKILDMPPNCPSCGMPNSQGGSVNNITININGESKTTWLSNILNKFSFIYVTFIISFILFYTETYIFPWILGWDFYVNGSWGFLLAAVWILLPCWDWTGKVVEGLLKFSFFLLLTWLLSYL